MQPLLDAYVNGCHIRTLELLQCYIDDDDSIVDFLLALTYPLSAAAKRLEVLIMENEDPLSAEVNTSEQVARALADVVHHNRRLRLIKSALRREHYRVYKTCRADLDESGSVEILRFFGMAPPREEVIVTKSMTITQKCAFLSAFPDYRKSFGGISAKETKRMITRYPDVRTMSSIFAYAAESVPRCVAVNPLYPFDQSSYDEQNQDDYPLDGGGFDLSEFADDYQEDE